MAQGLGIEFFFVIPQPLTTSQIERFEAIKYPRRNGAGMLNSQPVCDGG
ncbi:MAG: hypothetical protein OEM91_00735 [Hyphomicrobiales bacterium]|nr:hypothetical protein [Hyphomicrobiales bacterium]